MFSSLKDYLSKLWQHRFEHGFEFDLGKLSVNRYANGEIRVIVYLGMLSSTATGHWPWIPFECGYMSGSRNSWHIGILGLTIGQTWLAQSEVMESGETEVRPDINKFYFFFKCLNHQAQPVEEIIT